MRACQGTPQYSWWKLLMFSVMMWKRYSTNLSIDCSFIWMCQSAHASLLGDGSPQKKKDSRKVQFPSSHVKHKVFTLMNGLTRMNWAAPEDSLHRWRAEARLRRVSETRGWSADKMCLIGCFQQQFTLLEGAADASQRTQVMVKPADAVWQEMFP